jgi:hypothetical protein
MRSPAVLPLLALALLAPAVAADAPVTVLTDQSHRGWRDAVVLRNAVVETVIVPSIGRVMQFRFAGETDGPFWENEKLLGQPMPANPWRANPGSFGGDKTWPAPQSVWNWPPPDVFDTAPLTVRVNADHSVTLESPVSQRFGVRTVRRIALDPAAPVMRIETTYEKISGDPVTVAVWVITQLKDPAGIFIPVPAGSTFPDNIRPPVPAAFLKRETDGGDWLRLTRNPARTAKIGMDGSSMVWADEKFLLRIDLPRVADASYPDDGRSQQIYTNNDPVPYVELETISPQQTLKVGDRLSATNTYRLARRTAAPLETDLRALLAP